MNYVSKITIGGIFISLCTPTLLFAGTSLVTPVNPAMRAKVSWYAVNGHDCSLSGIDNTGITSNLDGTNQSKVYYRPTSGPLSPETHRIQCTGAIGSTQSGLIMANSSSLEVTGGVTIPDTTIDSFSRSSGLATDSLSMSWSGTNSPTRYEFTVDSNSWIDLGMLTSTAPAPAQDYIGGTTSGTTYTFKFRACNAAGCDPTPATRTYTVTAAPPTVNINFSMKVDELKKKFHQMFSRNEIKSPSLASSLR